MLGLNCVPSLWMRNSQAINNHNPSRSNAIGCNPPVVRVWRSDAHAYMVRYHIRLYTCPRGYFAYHIEGTAMRDNIVALPLSLGS